MEIKMNNTSNPEYESLFDDLIRDVFGFSFSPWFERKLWDTRYESYSIIENGMMLSNVCVFKVDMIIGGRKTRVHQYGAVATRAGYRGKGLSRSIIEQINSIYPEVPVFLSANPSVLNFYPRFGFRRFQEYQPFIYTNIDNTSSFERLKSDDDAIKSALKNRSQFSKLVDCTNTEPVLMFHLLLDYADDIYNLPACSAVIIAQQTDVELFVADVIAAKPLSWNEIVMALPFSGVKRVTFGFCPDWLGIDAHWEPIDSDSEPFFVKGSIDLPDKFIFPNTSRT